MLAATKTGQLELDKFAEDKELIVIGASGKYIPPDRPALLRFPKFIGAVLALGAT